ncbi:uncharacterized protein K452DRAFT_287978 [Aplosporella prunicola CBS 121167]|uniref:Uncharacterized protein n=1 Tax=Aplosporella prunicola CBS 121167 TaxID=1176127 RepID=A0A6A6BD27_9PEZI|nr:uncharacterized protein K452DRAFT_287978 [Aplosporella prunicola CBS 121167]KAF2141273.1 hypothetical protein K452DRAFT_287978 [Aplosporella prunicola CBS 121167]
MAMAMCLSGFEIETSSLVFGVLLGWSLLDAHPRCLGKHTHSRARTQVAGRRKEEASQPAARSTHNPPTVVHSLQPPSRATPFLTPFPLPLPRPQRQHASCQLQAPSEQALKQALTRTRTRTLPPYVYIPRTPYSVPFPRT